MNITNQPKNISILLIGSVLLSAFITFLFMGILLTPHVDLANNQSYDMLSLPRKTLISIQIVNMIGFFILPPVLFAFFSKNDFLRCFHLDKPAQLNKYLLATLLAFTLFPVLINIQDWVTKIPLSDSLRAIAENQKAATEKILELFLNYPGIENLFLMVLIIGAGAGITEELFFRGLLMPWIQGITKSRWVAIILSGAIFSLFHANFYDFLPILCVGILFGFLYSKTRDLKLNIYIHALFNSAQVITNYLHENKYVDADLENVKNFPIIFWLICLCLATALIYKIIKDYEHISHTS